MDVLGVRQKNTDLAKALAIAKYVELCVGLTRSVGSVSNVP